MNIKARISALLARPQRSVTQAGFTLIELLVVIAIIGLLMAAGTVAFTNAQQSARDSRRRQDMRAMQNAFEQYYSNNSSAYALNCSAMSTGYFPGNSLPADPKSGNSYACSSTATTYCTCAALEATGGKGNATDTNCSFGSGASANYFCVANRQ